MTHPLRALFGRWFDIAALKLRLRALWLLFKHPATPWPPKAVALLVLAYALSPIDLIPDFIPLLGQLDDLLILPLGLALAVVLAPKPLWLACLAEARAQASSGQRLPRWRAAAVAVVGVWLASAGLLLGWWAGWWLVP